MPELQQNEVKDIVESILFISKRPVSAFDINEATGFSRDQIEDSINSLEREYDGKALQVLRLANGFVLATRPKYSPFIEKFLKSPVLVSLSQQSLETLSIIAYKQPITKLDIDNIRGVMSDAPINTLLEKKLIKEAGRSDNIGRPILYATTVEFLKHFGLNDLSELPKMEDDESIRSAMSAESRIGGQDEGN